MLSPGCNIKIYLFTGYTDMRKGAKTLAYLAQNILSACELTEKMFVFRGKSADKIKVLWWDGQVASRSTQKKHSNVYMF